MKKILLVIIVLLCLFFLAAYLFFPKRVIASSVENIDCNSASITRFFMDENKWEKWWPGSVKRDSTTGKIIFNYNNTEYKVTGINYNTMLLQAFANGLTVNETAIIIPVNSDTNNVEWKYSLETNNNPINRVNLFIQTKKINKDLKKILAHLHTFLEKNENVYGLTINEIQVKDTILVSSKFTSLQYPSTETIYEKIDSIKNYVALNNAKETDYPMLHVWKDSGLFQITIAIPVDKRIPGSKNFSMKRMVPGKILVSQVKGGTATADEGLNQLGLFMTDNRLSSPAIPFEMLVTNRIREKDTSKWITKLYYPVF